MDYIVRAIHGSGDNNSDPWNKGFFSTIEKARVRANSLESSDGWNRYVWIETEDGEIVEYIRKPPEQYRRGGLR